MNDKKFKETENENLEDEIIELTGDQGEVLKFYHIGTIEYKNEWFVFFQPAEILDGVDPDEVVIFKIGGEEGDEVLLPIDDELLLEEVYNVFISEYEEDDEGEEFDGCDMDCENCENKDCDDRK